MLQIGSMIEDQEREVYYEIIWNGKEIDSNKAFAIKFSDENYHIVQYENVIEFSEIPLKSIPSHITSVEWSYNEQDNGEIDSIEVSINKQKIKYPFLFDSDSWNLPWSINEYIEELFRLYAQLDMNIKLISEDEIPSNDLHFLREEVSKDIITSVVNDDINEINKLLSLAKENLLIRVKPDALVTLFEFPEHLKTSCEQYLVYFSEFLKDIGYNVNTEIKEIGNKVLFSVTPKNQKDAIENIQQAFDIYLNLPTFDYTNKTNIDDIYIQKLKAQILHLQSQLLLSNATNQQLLENLQPNEKNNGVLIESVHYSSSSGKQEDKEEFFGGLLSVSKYKGKGFEVDLPAIFRKLKRKKS